MKFSNTYSFLFLVLFLSVNVTFAQVDQDPLLKIVNQELDGSGITASRATSESCLVSNPTDGVVLYNAAPQDVSPLLHLTTGDHVILTKFAVHNTTEEDVWFSDIFIEVADLAGDEGSLEVGDLQLYHLDNPSVLLTSGTYDSWFNGYYFPISEQLLLPPGITYFNIAKEVQSEPCYVIYQLLLSCYTSFYTPIGASIPFSILENKQKLSRILETNN